MTKTDINNDFTVGEINVSLQHNMLSLKNKNYRLQPKVMALLHYLALNKERVISNDELLDAVWQGRIVTHSSIQKCINALRTAFHDLDEGVDYVVYFSKRGYQLVAPTQTENTIANRTHTKWTKILPIIIFLLLFLVSLQDIIKESLFPQLFKSATFPTFTQVQPFVSNTGREKIILPHHSSDRVAFVRNEASLVSEQVESHLYIKNGNSAEWRVSVARGDFELMAWSASGRNLVVLDAHDEGSLSPSKIRFYTFHIYTFDFKAEKVIEKNTLSHWRGYVSSITWWDETTIDFTATQGKAPYNAHYRYRIADQNLSTVAPLTKSRSLLHIQTFSKVTAKLFLLNKTEYIQIVDESKQTLGEWALPFTVKSMSWLSHANGILLLSDSNQLFVFNIDGRIETLNYSPKIQGEITHVGSINEGQQIVFTVSNKSNLTEKRPDSTQSRFLNNGGGFIYSVNNN